MFHNPDMFATMPLGVVLRRSPGVTRWASWAWKAVAVLPGAATAEWHVLRQQDGVTEYHAATPMLELHGAETEAYLHALNAAVPSVYVVMRRTGAHDTVPLQVLLVTASPYEAQDYDDSGDEIVEKVPMPPGLVAWVRDFVRAHHQEDTFKKRRRDRVDVKKAEDGVGDARIPQMRDVFRSPASCKGRLQ